MALDNKVNLSVEDTKSLLHLCGLLHLFNHRNKNQHRRSIWWRHFSTFKRQLHNLTEEACSLSEVPTANLARAKKKSQDMKTHDRLHKRLTFWQDVLVPKWQLAFSQLVADGRFAVLGLVLVASLAEVCKIAGITASFEEMGQTEVEKVLEAFAEEGWDGEQQSKMDADLAQEDIGVAVKRNDSLPVATEDAYMDINVAAAAAKTGAREARSTGATKLKKCSTVQPKATTKKRRKKGDAIDDLFNDLD